MGLNGSGSLRTTLHAAQKTKEKGNKLLKTSKLRQAIVNYTRSNDLLLAAKDLDLFQHPKALSLFVANNLNLALVHLKLKQPDECIVFCDKVLHHEPNNAKALYRKGEALFTSGYRREAVALFEQVIKIEPQNKAARQYSLRLNELDLESLPDVILKQLCGLLEPKDVLNMRLISKKLERSMSAISTQVVAGMARSCELSICRSPKGTWSFEREVYREGLQRKKYGRSRKYIEASDSSLDLLLTVIRLNETRPSNHGNFTTAALTLDGAAAMHDNIRSLLVSLKSIRLVDLNFVGDLSVLQRACVKEIALKHRESIRTFKVENAWGYPNDVVDDDILTSLNTDVLTIRPHEALTPRQWPQLDHITDAVFDHIFSCALGETGESISRRPQYDLSGCTKLTMEGLCSALKRFATRGKPVDIKLRCCANFPDIHTVIEQLGDIGHARLEIFMFNARYSFGDTSRAVNISVEGARIQELLRNDAGNCGSVM